MSEAESTVQPEFHEWMITKALGIYLKADVQRTNWLFGLKVQCHDGQKLKLSQICGFDWDVREVKGGPEEIFKSGRDIGEIPDQEFGKFLGTAPDFRYWSAEGKKQLIIEAKGTLKPIGNRDRDQATRYFKYLRQFPASGGVVYVVPEPQKWGAWLTERAAVAGVSPGGSITWGVLNWKDEILPTISQDLVRVIGETLIQSAELLKEALSLPKV